MYHNISLVSETSRALAPSSHILHDRHAFSCLNIIKTKMMIWTILYDINWGSGGIKLRILPIS